MDNEKFGKNEVALDTFKMISEKVFPSIKEIQYCISNKLVSEKDLILFKLILDFNEAIFNN